MKKKILSTILATTLASAMIFTGCGSAATDGATQATAATEGSADVEYEKLVIFQSKVEIGDQLNAAAEQFSEETGIEVEVWETSGDNYYTDLKTDLSTEAGPTLFSLAPGSQSVEMADYLEDVSGLSFIDKVSDGMVDEIDGKVVGIPYTLEGFGLTYNKNLVDPATINSTDALVDFLASAKADGINGLGLSQESYFLIMHILNTPFALQENPEEFLAKVLSGETRMYDNEEFVEFAKVMEAIRANCTNPVDVSYDNNCGDFATGKTAMIHQGNWCYGNFADYDIDFEMGIAPLPLCGNNKIAVSVPAAWYINADATEGAKASAKAFLEWLYTSDAGADYLMNQFGFIPVVDGMTADSLDPLSASVGEAAAAGNTITWNLSIWPAGIDSNLAPVVSEFFVSDMTGEELVNNLNDVFVSAAN